MIKSTSNSEIIKARTPLYILGAGTLTLIATIAVVAVAPTERIDEELKKDLTDAAFGLAATAIAGASGLAQSNGKQEENQSSFENNKFQLARPNDNTSSTDQEENLSVTK